MIMVADGALFLLPLVCVCGCVRCQQTEFSFCGYVLFFPGFTPETSPAMAAEVQNLAALDDNLRALGAFMSGACVVSPVVLLAIITQLFHHACAIPYLLLPLFV